MIVIVDNFDSFVFNIARHFRLLGEAVEVIRNDAICAGDVERMHPSAVVVSPGPCTPAEAGNSVAIIRALSGRVPILGVCLGHQCIGAAFGGRIVRARRPMHGRACHIAHNGRGLFDSLPLPLCVGRYHSLIVELDSSPASPLVPTAHSEEGEIMAIAHRNHPTFGVQFHPESILSQSGHALFANFLRIRMPG